MKLAKLYSNQPDIFSSVEFTRLSALNVVLAEIRLPENRRKDTHNLGKTTLGRMLDFGLLSGRDPKFFLFRQFDLLAISSSFLRSSWQYGSYLTVRRSVAEPSRVAFKKHVVGHQDFSTLPAQGWDHSDVPFERAKDLLDGLLDWRALKPWPIEEPRLFPSLPG